MPKIAEIEYTPNPNAVKFLLKEPVALGFPKSFPSAEIAANDELAKALFDIGNVVSVFMQDKWLTVTKTDDVKWPDLLPKLATPIRAAASINGISNNEAATKREFNKINDQNDEILKKVQAILKKASSPPWPRMVAAWKS